VTVLREGYGLPQLRADAVAGLTVAIVALPLSMAIAIASGATPAQGLSTAIVGGFLVSMLGGSRFQIGGEVGAAWHPGRLAGWGGVPMRRVTDRLSRQMNLSAFRPGTSG
jgi:hypothetical protein